MAACAERMAACAAARSCESAAAPDVPAACESECVPEVAPTPVSGPQSTLIRHATIPDGTRVEMGQVVVKSWVVANRGAESWPQACKLIFVRGDRELLGETEEFSVNSAKPAQELDVSVPITTPIKPGRYTALFQLADADRKVFGARFGIDIQVTGDDEDERKKSAAPVAVTKSSYPPSVDTSGWIDVKVDTTTAPAVAPAATVAPTVAPTATVPASKPAVVVAVPVAKPAEPVKPATATPKPAATPAAPAPKPSKWESQLTSLANMGFKNTELNSFLLEKHNGDLQRVTNWLIENMSAQ